MARAIHVFRTPDRFVAGTVGQPGNRTFYLQAVHDARVVSVILEKQQVAVLAERIGALLVEVNRRFGTPLPPEGAEVDDLFGDGRTAVKVALGRYVSKASIGTITTANNPIQASINTVSARTAA